MSLFPETDNPSEYRVLARKYRPKTFDELIGQEILVKTLSNAIQTGRIAHAFILTGVRGIGKTTTARIIARALNCTGEDGNSGPTITPCGKCDNCTAIAADRHIDVLEMDAASRTGVDDIREIIDGVRYRPTSGRFKIYIIDEVHMLSKNAFNALLKTLEEPPESVKFIFATTEINKVPVTVLSRCQRFDLRRLDADGLAKHLQNISAKENYALDDDAARLLAQAADGSVRDGLSLLDQAMAHSAGTIAADGVRNMLGLADNSQIYELLDLVLDAKTADALQLCEKLHNAGADALMIAQDLLRAAHAVTRNKVPVTVLSRCQRFDLRRLDADGLAKHLQNISAKENYALDDDAARLLAQAADGSVRDGLSLLDQAMAHSAGTIAADGVRNMLGLADNSQIYELLDLVLDAKTADALQLCEKLHNAGADALMIAQDLLRAAHAVTRFKVAGHNDLLSSDTERQKRQTIADQIGIPVLSRVWQMLLKGIAEIQIAPHPAIALEMVLIRLCYAAELPNIAQIVESMPQGGAINPPPQQPAMTQPANISNNTAPHRAQTAPQGGYAATSAVATDRNLALAPNINAAPESLLHSYRDLVNLFADKKEILLYHDLYQNSHLVEFADGKIEIRIGDKVRQPNFVNQVGKLLSEWTGKRWMVLVSQKPGQATLQQQDQIKHQEMLHLVGQHPAVQAAILAFPGAKVVNVKERVQPADSAADADENMKSTDIIEEDMVLS